jgi:hypothetical protein
MHSIVWLWATGIHDPAWLQAIAAVALLVLTLPTLIALAIYKYFTYRQARASQLSAEAAKTASDAAKSNAEAVIITERPWLAVEIRYHRPTVSYCLVLAILPLDEMIHFVER